MFELTYNYGVQSYDKGNAYAQIAISTTVGVLGNHGVGLSRGPGGSVGGMRGTGWQASAASGWHRISACTHPLVALLPLSTHPPAHPPPSPPTQPAGCLQDCGAGQGSGGQGDAGAGAGAGHRHKNIGLHRPRWVSGIGN